MEKINWILLCRAKEPLAVAREMILFSTRAALDEDAERFLGTLLDQLDAYDLLTWLVRRGHDAPENPPRTVPSSVIAQRYVASCDPDSDLPVCGSGEWIAKIEPTVWDGILEQLLPTLKAPWRSLVLRTARGCETFNQVHDREANEPDDIASINLRGNGCGSSAVAQRDLVA